MVSNLYGEYSVTHAAAKVAWYSPYMRWSRGGVSVRSVGGDKGWVIGLGCGRGFSGYGFLKDVLLGYCGGSFMGQVNGWELGHHMDFPWEIFNGPWLGDLEGFLFGNFRWTLAV